MKSLLFLFLLLSVGFSAMAQTDAPFLNTPFNYDDVNAVKDKIAILLDKGFRMMSMKYPDKTSDMAEYHYMNDAGEFVDIYIKKGVINSDLDLGKKGDEVIDRINIVGFFPDIFMIYKTLFNFVVDEEVIKRKGSAPSLNMNKTSVTFFRSGKTGYWAIWDKKS